MLSKLDRSFQVNGKTFNTYQELLDSGIEGKVEIFIPKSNGTTSKSELLETVYEQIDCNNQVVEPNQAETYRVMVRRYMTKPSTPEFDFMRNWNHNVPMPLIVMVGEIVGETKGMYRMKLRGEPRATKNCIKCGRTLTNPISLMYGIGPECGQHFHIGNFTDAEIQSELESIKQTIANIQWEGWIIKSAIKEMVAINDELPDLMEVPF